MSVRIHEISKQTGVPNKEIVELLKKRGYEVSTASSGIDPISAESLIEELGRVKEPEPAVPEPTPEVEASKKEAPSQVAPPLSAFVHSKADIEREKEEKRLEEEEKRKPAAAPPPPAPVSPATVPPPVSAAPKAPPVPPSTSPTRLAAPPPIPKTTSPAALTPPSSPPPPPVVGGPTSTPVADTPAPPESAETEEVDAGGSVAPVASGVKMVTVKPPIVVKEFALEIGLKPFKLTSDCNSESFLSSFA